MLLRQQREDFESKGYVRLPSASGAPARDLEDFVWSCLAALHGIQRDNAATWGVAAAWAGLKQFRGAPVLQQIGVGPICGVLDELLGPGQWKKPRDWGGFLVNFPDTEPSAWRVPSTGWHVDAHFTGDPAQLFGVRVFTLLSTVEGCGGATVAVSGSHRLAAEYARQLTAQDHKRGLRKLTAELLSSNAWLRKLSQADEASLARTRELTAETATVGGAELRVEQLTGHAGDIIVMHPWLLHARSPHAGGQPRFALAKGIYVNEPGPMPSRLDDGV